MKTTAGAPKTIAEVVRRGLCIFCGTCGSACPHGLITFPFADGYRLDIDTSRCDECSACVSVCPGWAAIRPGKKHPGNGENYYIGEFGGIFSAFANDFDRRFAGSSGGVVTQIVASLLADRAVDGAVLTRLSREAAFKPEGFVAAGVDDVLAAQGSKYSPVPLNVLLARLDPAKKYAYVGLPCHLQGLDMYLKKFPGSLSGNFFKIGLFCSRTNALPATKELLRLNGIDKDEVESIRYRGFGHPGYFSVACRGGKKIRIPHLDDSYWSILFKRYFVQYRCWLCPDKTALYADISCGDDWSRGLFEDRVGSSSVICRTPAALDYFERLVARGELTAAPLQLESLAASQGLAGKMNIRRRQRIAAFFKLPVPGYPGYEFKKEPLPLRHELAMLMRIRWQGRRAVRWLMAGDFFFSARFRALRSWPISKRYFLLFWRVAPRKFRQLLKGVMKPEISPAAENGRGKRLHIVTCGGYGYQDIGDEAMPKALIANLIKGFPEGLAVTMLSPDPAYTRRYHGHPAISDIQFHSAKEDTAGLNREMERYLQWAREYAKKPKSLFFKLLLWQRREFFGILRAIARSDALLNVGGGNINSVIRKELYKKCTLQRVAHVLGKPIFISGQTIGPFDNDNDRSLAREALELASVLTFRDRGISVARVAAIGVRGPLMYDAGDDALSLAAISRTEAQKLIAADAGEEWTGLKADAVWGINLKGSLKLFKGAGRSGDLASETGLMAQLCEHILKSSAAKLLLVATDFCPGVDDREALRLLRQKIDPSLRPRVALLEETYNDHQLKGITGCCDFVLGCRYHFLVFALSGIVPAIGIASGLYQQTKLKGILQLLDLDDCFVPSDMEYATAAEIIPFIKFLTENRDEIREKLRRHVPALTARSVEIVSHIRARLPVRP